MPNKKDIDLTQCTIQWIKLPWYDRFFLSKLRRAFPEPIIQIKPPIDDMPIRIRIKRTGKLGRLKLWEGYGEKDGERASHMVSSQLVSARFFSALALDVKPKTVVEFGTAFGVSGMHWLSAVKQNEYGHVFTYEVNKEWAAIAKANLEAISQKGFTLTVDTFENAVDETLKGKKISVAFIDGVHTSEWVVPQYELIRARLEHHGIILLDDITFSDDMKDCWKTIVETSNPRYAAVVNNRIGLLQF